MGTVDLIDHGRDQTRGADWTLWRSDPCVRPDHVHRHGRSSFTWRYFETIKELRQAPLAFQEIYNAIWLIERHGFLGLAECRQQQLQPVAAAAWGSIRGVPETEGGPRARYPVDHSAAMTVVFYGEQTF